MNKIETVQKHVRRNRAKYAAGATLIACGYLHYKVGQQWNEFLKENYLYDKFYEA